MQVLALVGSLRHGSYNAGLARAARELAPAGMTVEIADISAIPLYNGDQDGEQRPAAVTALAEQVGAADALLFVTPEYNFSIPGVLKNTIDWLSRVPAARMAGKACAIMGASMGGMGSSRAQYHLRQVLASLDLHPLNKPEVFVSVAHQKSDAQGDLQDEKSRALIGKQLAELQDWHRQLQR